MKWGILFVIQTLLSLLTWGLANKVVTSLCLWAGTRRVRTAQQLLFGGVSILMALATRTNTDADADAEREFDRLIGTPNRAWADAIMYSTLGFFLEDTVWRSTTLVTKVHHIGVVTSLSVCIYMDRYFPFVGPFLLWSEVGGFLYSVFVLFIPSNWMTFAIYNLLYCVPRFCILHHYMWCVRHTLRGGHTTGTGVLLLVALFLIPQLYAWWLHLEGWWRGKSLTETSAGSRPTPTPSRPAPPRPSPPRPSKGSHRTIEDPPRK